jgi:5'-nucleotidase
MIIDRRKFFRETIGAGGILLAASLLPGETVAEERRGNLTILHTNDVHSRLDPFPQDGSKNAGLGGVAARSELIRQIRSETESVLLVDAGDIFQGTPYFNVYKGEPEIKAMSMMEYDAATMGNHDFDAGIENFANQLKHANFPIVICNYDFTGTAMEGKSVPYRVFQKGDVKVGVLGVGIELKGLVADYLYGSTVYEDPIDRANVTAATLRKRGCDLIVCLSHLGDKYLDDKISDEVLAKECFDIDLIIGGHTHRFFETPRVYRNQRGGDTVVNQVGWAGIQLGRLDYSLARAGSKKPIRSRTVVIGKKETE